MPKLTDDQVQERLEEVKRLKFQLDPDPTVLGLSSLLVKLAEVQMYKSRVSTMITEAMTNVAIHEIEKEQAQSEYDRNLELNLTDEKVAAQKSAELRNTHAKLKMPELVMKLHGTEVSHIKANWYYKILQSIYSDLESANANLSRQISVIQLEQNFNPGPKTGAIKNLNY